MPKIVSSSTVSASSDLQTAVEKNLLVYYCLLCNEYVLIVDKRLSKLPRRKTDNACIITEAHTFKLNLKRGPTTIIQREGGYEKQSGWDCPGCGVPIAYDQEEDGRPFVYILDGAVQGAGATRGGANKILGPDGKVLDKRPSALQATAEQLIRESKERVRTYA
ncbi:hypothetical protein HDU87_004040 [Geranomyces variabilis]|uniref:STEEP1 domain-containing protein n=1 Tax=Geranomyces variabilis TaxID=109894 RepID=A0AAD5TR08_9FUNG|nr:hypothetical protein HDU87_004040 [Geranomyces variabilis]